MGRQAIECAGYLSGGAAPMILVSELASQTFSKGAVLIDSGGFVKEAGADPTDVAFISAEAGKNNSTNGGANCLVYPIWPGVVFEISVDDSGSLGSGVVAKADRYQEHGIAVTSTSKRVWYLDAAENSGANSRVRIIDTVEALPRTITSTQARVRVVFTHDITDWNDT